MEGKERIDTWPEHLTVGVALTERGVPGTEAPFGGTIKSSCVGDVTKEAFFSAPKHIKVQLMGGRSWREARALKGRARC